MIFQPAILALFFADGVAVPLMAVSVGFAWQVVRRWDITSGSSDQLRLERRTLLAATLVAFACLTQGVSLLLLVYTADHLADLFTGAMCAVGSLQAAPLGFLALTLRLAVFFAAAAWLVVNHLDNRCPDYPLTRAKYGLLLWLFPLVTITAGVQGYYFLGLNADVITSCCGSLFENRTVNLSGQLTAWPVQPMMAGLAVAWLAVVTSGLWVMVGQRGMVLFAAGGVLHLLTALAAVISFLSPYVYEHPHHHCPFCLLKPEYHHVGYLLYVPLFIATALALGVGMAASLAGGKGLSVQALTGVKSLVRLSLFLYGGFALVVLGLVTGSNLKLLE